MSPVPDLGPEQAAMCQIVDRRKCHRWQIVYQQMTLSVVQNLAPVTPYMVHNSGIGDSFCGPQSGTSDTFLETYSKSFSAVEAYLKQKTSSDLIMT